MISVDDIINNILSRDSNYIVDLFLWLKFGNSSISMREVITTSIHQKNHFFWGVVLVQIQWSGTGTRFKFDTNVTKDEKLKIRKFGALIPAFVEVTGEKLVGGRFLPLPPPSWIGLTPNFSITYLE